MIVSDFTIAIIELEKAEIARNKGKEGQARVLSRLAASSAIKIYLALKELPVQPINAYELILLFSKTPEIPAGLTEILDHLLMKVDENYNLPEGIDLIADVYQFIKLLESSNE